MSKRKAARVDCPHCATWRTTHAGETPRSTGFTMDGTVWHYAPDIWLASRAQQCGGDVLDAMGQWAEMCGLILAAQVPSVHEAHV